MRTIKKKKLKTLIFLHLDLTLNSKCLIINHFFYIRYTFPRVLEDPDHVSTCDRSHVDTCDRCVRLASVVNEIEDALKEAECMNDTREELVFVASQAKQHIQSWKSHLLRSTNQDDCRLDIIKELDETSVLLVLDWAMKYLPRKFRESQTDCMAKEESHGLLQLR